MAFWEFVAVFERLDPCLGSCLRWVCWPLGFQPLQIWNYCWLIKSKVKSTIKICQFWGEKLYTIYRFWCIMRNRGVQKLIFSFEHPVVLGVCLSNCSFFSARIWVHTGCLIQGLVISQKKCSLFFLKIIYIGCCASICQVKLFWIHWCASVWISFSRESGYGTETMHFWFYGDKTKMNVKGVRFFLFWTSLQAYCF